MEYEKQPESYIMGVAKDGMTPVIDEAQMWSQIFSQLTPAEKEKFRGPKLSKYFE